MYSYSRILIKSVLWIMLGMVIVVTLRPGGVFALRVGQFAPLCGAFIGGSLVLSSVCFPQRLLQAPAGQQNRMERVSWFLLGLGMIAWGIGDSFWRYYISIGQTPFPSLADYGYVAFSILVLVGLLLQPSSNLKGRRLMLIMDSMIATGCILAIAWYLLLGPMVLTPSEGGLAKVLGLYYPASDTILLSCVVFLLLRWQGPMQRSATYGISLLIIGIGLCFFITSDFLFNMQQNAGTYVEATWVDLGWPLGLMIVGIAAVLRRFPLLLPDALFAYIEQNRKRSLLGPPQYMPYGLFAVLLIVLTSNIFAADRVQQAIRPVLLCITLIVVILMIVRQFMTLQENVWLVQQQAEALEELRKVNLQVEAQKRAMAERNAELEQGIEQLKIVLAHLANGQVQTRATARGVLWPLAVGLNLIADRLSHFGQDTHRTQQLLKALEELSNAIEPGRPLCIPTICYNVPELHSLITALQQWNGFAGLFPHQQSTSSTSARLIAYRQTQKKETFSDEK